MDYKVHEFIILNEDIFLKMFNDKKGQFFLTLRFTFALIFIFTQFK